MKEDQREIQRKLRVLEHADVSGNVRKTCRYFGIGRASFYRWQAAYRRHGEHGSINKKPIPKNPANKTTPEIEEKVLHLRRTYHLGPDRICGISSAITPSRCRMPMSTAFSGETV